MDQFNDEIRLVLIGKTGTGKSSTGNTLLDKEEFDAKNQVLAVTGKASFGTRILNNKKLIVVDTPGILDTHRDREEIKLEIIRSIGLCVPGPHAVLYVMRIGDRLTDDEHKCIRIFTDMFGENILKFAIIVFTKGKDLENTTLDQYFKNAPEPFQNLLNKCGNRMLALDNKGTDNEKREAVDNLLWMIDTMNSGQTYYSDKMLKCAQVAFMKKVKELGKVDKVRRDIKIGGPSFQTLVIAVGLGSIVGALLTSAVIAGPVVLVAKASASVGVASKVGGTAAVASKVGGTAVVVSKVGGTAAVASTVGGTAGFFGFVGKVGALFSGCSIL